MAVITIRDYCGSGGMDMRFIKSLAFCAAALTAASSYATALQASDILSQFNAVVKTTFTSGHDVEGRLVANEVAGGATFYNNPSNTPSVFAAINAIKIDNFNANINNGGKVDYQTSNAAHFNYNGGGSATQSPIFAMNDFTAPLDALANQLSALRANSVVNAYDPNNFTFLLTPDASGTAVFDMTTAQLANSRNLVFSGTASTIIINVSGTTFNDTTNFNATSFLNSHIIWNFEDATSLNFMGWHGAVLAGKASVTNSSAMEGMLYANSFTGNGELHDVAFAGTLPTIIGAVAVAVPEPATTALFVTGLMLLLVLARERLRQAPGVPRHPSPAALHA